MISASYIQEQMAHLMTQETGAQGGVRPGATPGAGDFFGHDALTVGGRSVKPSNHQEGSTPSVPKSARRFRASEAVRGDVAEMRHSAVSFGGLRLATPQGLSFSESGVSFPGFPADLFSRARGLMGATVMGTQGHEDARRDLPGDIMQERERWGTGPADAATLTGASPVRFDVMGDA